MLHKKIKLVVFDIAGTTVQDNGYVANFLQQSMRKNGFQVSQQDANKVMGYRKDIAIEMLLSQHFPTQEINNGLVEKIHTCFITEMVEFYENNKELKPLPNAELIFSRLQSHQIKVALNTGFPKQITNVILKKLGWNYTKLIDCTVSADEVKNGRPSPDMIKLIMFKTAVEQPEHVAKIGDTEVDIMEGRMAKCGLVIAASTGAFSRNELQSCNPDAIIDDLLELESIITHAAVA
jgi:phosphonatase-like hydrolase